MEHLFGRKYWANIIATRGVADRYEVASFVFCSRSEARDHAERLRDNLSFMWVDTVSFRSRKL